MGAIAREVRSGVPRVESPALVRLAVWQAADQPEALLIFEQSTGSQDPTSESIATRLKASRHVRKLGSQVRECESCEQRQGTASDGAEEYQRRPVSDG
eukprot:1956917-Prymnesium_polylepis.4